MNWIQKIVSTWILKWDVHPTSLSSSWWIHTLSLATAACLKAPDGKHWSSSPTCLCGAWLQPGSSASHNRSWASWDGSTRGLVLLLRKWTSEHLLRTTGEAGGGNPNHASSCPVLAVTSTHISLPTASHVMEPKAKVKETKPAFGGRAGLRTARPMVLQGWRSGGVHGHIRTQRGRPLATPRYPGPPRVCHPCKNGAVSSPTSTSRSCPLKPLSWVVSHLLLSQLRVLSTCL